MSTRLVTVVIAVQAGDGVQDPSLHDIRRRLTWVLYTSSQGQEDFKLDLRAVNQEEGA